MKIDYDGAEELQYYIEIKTEGHKSMDKTTLGWTLCTADGKGGYIDRIEAEQRAVDIMCELEQKGWIRPQVRVIQEIFKCEVTNNNHKNEVTND